MSKANEQAVVDVFFALGDPTRLSLVKRLGQGQALSATALSERAQVTRQAIAKHLHVLEAAGLVTRKRVGREVVHSLEKRRLQVARTFLDHMSATWDQRIERLRSLVEER